MYIVCVHQGVELYGSDRSFLLAVEAIRNHWPQARLKVVLPAEGPLNAHVAKVADEVEVRSIGALRLAEAGKTLFKMTLGLPWYLGRAANDVLRADITYINTCVIADYIMAARAAPSKSVLHIREIPRPKAMPVFKTLCRLSGASFIFNSRATLDAFSLTGARRQAVVYNGVDEVPGATPPAIPAAFTAERPLRIAMLGRINGWKGQDLLAEAVGLLEPEDRRRVAVRIVGGTFGSQVEHLEVLKARIAEKQLENIVTIEPFTDNPDTVYRWSDLSAVPSRLPEPFGRVAIEAMAHGRPVIAAAHGGLTEILEDGSGWLFPPNDAAAIRDILLEILNRPDVLVEKGQGALRRFADNFTTEVIQKGVIEQLETVLAARQK